MLVKILKASDETRCEQKDYQLYDTQTRTTETHNEHWAPPTFPLCKK